MNLAIGLQAVDVAMRHAVRRCPHTPVEDLRSDAYLGLAQALDGFDPAKGAQFRTYAVRRITSAIADGERARRRAVGWVRDWRVGARGHGSRQVVAFISWEAYLEPRGHLL